MKNYALVRKTDFVDAGNLATKSDAIDAVDAKSDAALANLADPKPTKKRTQGRSEAFGCVSVGVEGLEPPTPSV